MDASGVGSTLKVWFELARSIFVVSLVLIAIVFPQATAEQLKSYGKIFGVSKVPTPFGDVDLERIGPVVENVRAETGEVATAMRSISSTVQDPNTRERLLAAANVLDTQVQALAKPNTAIANVVQKEVEAGKPAALEGWIYAGPVDKSGKAWNPSPSHVIADMPQFKVGDTVSIRDSVYVRGDSKRFKKDGPLVGVLDGGDKVKVTKEPSITPAVSGGGFLWLHVAKGE